MSHDTALGPIDFILIEFPDGSATVPVAEELADVLESGVVRLYDIAIVHRDPSGAVSRGAFGSADEGDGAGLRGMARFAGGQSGLFDTTDVAEAGRALEPGTSGLMLAYENTWASGFVAAADGAGGRVVAADRIPAQALLDALDALDELDQGLGIA